ncbi:hypothetical protein GBF38_019737 [Nibea albiflora]|uniref:Uncharacterized protein n=1 Tax=Nibea albiflora TaxID=240163 RepID=A0ACB7F2C7_NIBAL|nr:hypothetical protein GBF38_019737 [Nibea albiflora]
MHSIYMIFTALATTALAKGSIECNFSEPTGAQCFGKVGQPLLFHLTNTANPDIRLIKDDKIPILKVKNHKMSSNNEYVNHFELFTNGTFKLGNAMKKHSGDYLLIEYGVDGTLLRNVTVRLEIQAAISHFRVVMAVRAGVVFLLLSVLCLCIRHVHKKTGPVKACEEGVARGFAHKDSGDKTATEAYICKDGSIECNFSEPTGAQCFGTVGQPLLFHLTNTANPDIRLIKDDKIPILKVKNHKMSLNNEYVNHFELFTNGTFKLGNAMKKHSGDYLLTEYGVDGTLLRNVTVRLEIQGSISHYSLVAVAVIASAITLLLHVALFVVFKQLNKKTRPVTVSKDNAEDEIVYSDVRVMKHTRKTRATSEQNPS